MNGVEAANAGYEKCEDNCNTILFSDLVGKLELIEGNRGGKKNKLEVIFTRELNDLVSGQSVFPLVRLLLPLYDTERQRYGLKQATVAKTYVDALQLNRTSQDAQRLLHWKDQSKLQKGNSNGAVGGDFCNILEDVLKSRVRQDASTATLGDINELLNKLTECFGEAGKVSFIRERVLTKFSAREQKWLMRIIFQDLKIGIKLESVLGYLSRWASQCYAECSDLRVICEGGRGKKRPMGICPHSVFTPMLAKGFPNTGQLVEVERSMGGNPFVMDVKLDGERMLCHVDSTKGCRLLTRNGNDYTQKYQKLATDLRHIMKSCSAYILDGEVCAYDIRSDKYVQFGNNRTVGIFENNEAVASGALTASPGRKEKAASEEELPASPSLCLVYIVFDVVYAEGVGVAEDVNRILRNYAREEAEGLHTSDLSTIIPTSDLAAMGGELTQLPLYARRLFLKDRLIVKPQRVILMQHKLILAADVLDRQRHLEAYFNEMMETGEEGLVVKCWTSTYELGEKSRSRNAKWIKMKPEYSNNMTDLDLLILGGYYGEGKGVRADGISHFLMGVKDDLRSTDDCVKYLTVGKIGTGYSFAELEELRNKLNPHWKPWPAAGSRIPDHFSPWKIGKNDDIPHVWIPPSESCIVETKCAEIIVSASFAIGLTCRFPRARRIRYDKEIAGVMTSTEFISAQNRARTMVDLQTTVDSDKLISGRKKRTRAAVGAETLPVLKRSVVPNTASYTLEAPQQLNVTADIFGGKVFCVLENTFNIPNGLCAGAKARCFDSKTFGEVIYSYGGVAVANPIDSATIVLCGNKRTQSVKNIISAKKFDVIDFCYIFECIEAGHVLPIRPRHYVGMSEETSARFLRGNDLFGDSYTEAISEVDLARIYDDMDYAFAIFDGDRRIISENNAPISIVDIRESENYDCTLSQYATLKCDR